MILPPAPVAQCRGTIICPAYRLRKAPRSRNLRAREPLQGERLRRRLLKRQLAKLMPRDSDLLEWGFVMGRDLDTRFSQLLEGIAKHENITVEMLGKTFASKEIENRRTFYPQLKQVLLQQELDIAEFKKIITNCWASGSRFDLIQFGRFTKEEDAAEVLIQTLIKDFPRNDAEAAARIDAYITDAVRLGYQDKKGSPNGSAAAALCSVLLTALFPERFVDYRQSRWRDFARKVGYDIPFPATGSYGLGIVWPGNLRQTSREPEHSNEYGMAKTPYGRSRALPGYCLD